MIEPTKADLIKQIEALYIERATWIGEGKTYQHQIENLKGRCLTQRQMYMDECTKRRAMEEAYHGVKTALDSALKNAQYSIQRPDVLDFFSKAIDRAILFCPKCGKIALGLKGHSGLRFCPTCADKTEWPWPKDYEQDGYTLAE